MDISGSQKINAPRQGVFNALLKEPGKQPLQIAAEMNLVQDSDEGNVAAWIEEVLNKMPDKVAEYKKGKKGLVGLFAGEVKKLSRGKADKRRLDCLF